jgi:hypothetical protein
MAARLAVQEGSLTEVVRGGAGVRQAMALWLHGVGCCLRASRGAP